ncbi:MAG: DinB family protein [Bacteroidetes bacterium]|nr:DinB family protein [Bacteroidota bacterium]
MKTEYLTLLSMANFTLSRNLENITNEESLNRIGENGNCINWLAGHILSVRDAVFSNFGMVKFLSEEECKRYERGSAPIDASENPVSFQKIKEGLATTYSRWTDIIKSKDEDFFDTPIPAEGLPLPIPEPTIGKLLFILAYHEGYHTGQIGLAQRAMGKEFSLKL